MQKRPIKKQRIEIKLVLLILKREYIYIRYKTLYNKKLAAKKYLGKLRTLD